MKLSEIITEGKISKKGIEYFEKHLQEIEELKKENAKMDEAFGRIRYPFSHIGYVSYPSKFYTKEEFISEYEEEIKKKWDELNKQLDELKAKIDQFNKLPWHKKLFTKL